MGVHGSGSTLWTRRPNPNRLIWFGFCSCSGPTLTYPNKPELNWFGQRVIDFKLETRSPYPTTQTSQLPFRLPPHSSVTEEKISAHRSLCHHPKRFQQCRRPLSTSTAAPSCSILHHARLRSTRQAQRDLVSLSHLCAVSSIARPRLSVVLRALSPTAWPRPSITSP